jgi:hypothetical protein
MLRLPSFARSRPAVFARSVRRAAIIACSALGFISLTRLPAVSHAAAPEPIKHPANGTVFKPDDVDFAHPIHRTEFDDPAERRDWLLEGGRAMTIKEGKLILESAPHSDPKERSLNHLVCWLRKEVPADFLAEFTVRPQNKQDGLNIFFFNARGKGGRSIFDPRLARRDGLFVQYTEGDLDSYHVSYWAPPRSTTHIRKNSGFHLVAVSDLDVIAASKPETFETVRVYKRGAKIRVMVNDRVLVAWDDDGKTFGPVHTHSGWVGLRQMGYTQRCEYERFAVFPLKAAAP